MSKKTIYERITECVPTGRWYTLKEICNLINSPSLTLVKLTLFAMPNVQWQRVEHKESPIKHPMAINWQWKFFIIDGGD